MLAQVQEKLTQSWPALQESWQPFLLAEELLSCLLPIPL